MFKLVSDTELVNAKFPIVCWSKEGQGYEKRVIQRRVIDSFSEVSRLVQYSVDMYAPNGVKDFTAKLSRGYIQKFYFIREDLR